MDKTQKKIREKKLSVPYYRAMSFPSFSPLFCILIPLNPLQLDIVFVSSSLVFFCLVNVFNLKFLLSGWSTLASCRVCEKNYLTVYEKICFWLSCVILNSKVGMCWRTFYKSIIVSSSGKWARSTKSWMNAVVCWPQLSADTHPAALSLPLLTRTKGRK